MTAPARMRLTAAEANALLTAPRQSKGRFPVAKEERRTVDGIVFDSLGEAKHYGELKLRERAGEIGRLERQPAFPIWINGIKVCTVHLDFSYVVNATGDIVIADAKSSGTAKDAAYSLRKRLVEAAYGIKIIEVIA